LDTFTDLRRQQQRLEGPITRAVSAFMSGVRTHKVKLVPVQSYVGVEVHLHSFLTSALNGVE
jgi:hypothetical protein